MSNRTTTYYIDTTTENAARVATHNMKTFGFFIKEAQHWARRAVERLKDSDDTDFARVFNIIFKTPMHNQTPLPNSQGWQKHNGSQPEYQWRPALDHVVWALSDFADNWVQTSNRAQANVRFFSDNRVRWVRVPDNTYYDPVNQVCYLDGQGWDRLVHEKAFGSNGVPGTGAGPFMVPNMAPLHEQGPVRENPRRHVIDVNPHTWWELKDWDMWLGGKMNLDGVDLEEVITSSMTRLVLHEVLRAPPYLLDDAMHEVNSSLPRSGWQACAMRCTKDRAYRNAESLALLGLWAALADTRPQFLVSGGFSLDREWDLIAGSPEDVWFGPGAGVPGMGKWAPNLSSGSGWTRKNPVLIRTIMPYRDITGTLR